MNGPAVWQDNEEGDFFMLNVAMTFVLALMLLAIAIGLFSITKMLKLILDVMERIEGKIGKSL